MYVLSPVLNCCIDWPPLHHTSPNFISFVDRLFCLCWVFFFLLCVFDNVKARAKYAPEGPPFKRKKNKNVTALWAWLLYMDIERELQVYPLASCLSLLPPDQVTQTRSTGPSCCNGAGSGACWWPALWPSWTLWPTRSAPSARPLWAFPPSQPPRVAAVSELTLTCTAKWCPFFRQRQRGWKMSWPVWQLEG